MRIIFKDSELKHFGIQGQKWGIRRFQNEDGTYTEAGKERYFKGERKTTSVGVNDSGGKGWVHSWSKMKGVNPEEQIELNKKIAALNEDPDNFDSLEDYDQQFFDAYFDLEDKYSEIANKAAEIYVKEGKDKVFDYLDSEMGDVICDYNLLDTDYGQTGVYGNSATRYGLRQVTSTLRLIGEKGTVSFDADGIVFDDEWNPDIPQTKWDDKGVGEMKFLKDYKK